MGLMDMTTTHQKKILVLTGDNSSCRTIIENALDETYEITLKSAIMEISSFINAYEPNIMLHDWTAIDESQ